MSMELSLHDRRRQPTSAELAGIPWLPALSPSVWRNADAELRLGRATDWEELPDGDFAPVGQKVWRIDGREVPLLEIRQLVLTSA